MLGRPPARHGMIAKPSGIVFVALIVSSPRIQRWRWWQQKLASYPTNNHSCFHFCVSISSFVVTDIATVILN